MLGRCAAPAIVSRRESRNRRGDPFRVAVEVREVELADDRQRRSGDLGEPIVEVLGEQPVLGGLGDRKLELERAALHLPHPLAHAGRQLRRVAAGVDPGAQVGLDRGVQVAGLERRVLGLGERAQLGRGLAAGQRGPGDHQPGDEVGARERQVERDQAAERGADHGCRAEREAVEQLGEVPGGGVGLGQDRRAPEAAQVAADDGVRGRVGIHTPLGVPHAAVAGTRVDEEQRRAVARGLVPELQARGGPTGPTDRRARRRARGAGPGCRAAARRPARA